MRICEMSCFPSIRKSSRRSNKFFGRNKVKVSKFAVSVVGMILLAAVLPAISDAAPAGRPGGSAQQQVTHNFDRSIPLPSGQSLRIEHKFGDITVRTHVSRDVHVSAAIHVSAFSQQDAETYANQIQIHVESSPSGVLVRTDYPQQNDSWWSHKNFSVSVEYTIDMPQDAPLTVRNKFGKISVAGLKAATDINDEQGSVTVHDGFGTVSAANIERATTITSSNGSVRLHHAGTSTVSNSFGFVEVGDI